MTDIKTCLICKPASELSKEELPYWSKKVIIHHIQS